MFEADDDRGPSLRPIPFRKLEAIAKHADIARVGVKEIDGPVFSFQTVVAKGTCDFEFDSPKANNEQIGGSL